MPSHQSTDKVFGYGVVLWYTPILAFRLAEAEQLFVTLQYQFCQFIIGDVVRRLYVVLWLTIGKA